MAYSDVNNAQIIISNYALFSPSPSLRMQLDNDMDDLVVEFQPILVWLLSAFLIDWLITVGLELRSISPYLYIYIFTY